jgi:hypothetical protein
MRTFQNMERMTKRKIRSLGKVALRQHQKDTAKTISK